MFFIWKRVFSINNGKGRSFSIIPCRDFAFVKPAKGKKEHGERIEIVLEK